MMHISTVEFETDEALTLQPEYAPMLDGEDDFVEAPDIQECSVEMWIEPNVPEQMGLYDGGNPSENDQAYRIYIYKPCGLSPRSDFDNTYGVSVVFLSNDIAIPFDVIQKGRHHIAVS